MDKVRIFFIAARGGWMNARAAGGGRVAASSLWINKC